MNAILPAASVADLTEAERSRILAKTARFAPPPARTADGRTDLVGLSRAELTEELERIGEKPFRAKQLWHWIYHQGATDFARMSTIAKPLQAKLAEHFVIGRPEPAVVQTSTDVALVAAKLAGAAVPANMVSSKASMLRMISRSAR